MNSIRSAFGNEVSSDRGAPGPGIGLGVVDRDLNVHVPEVLAPEARRHVQRLRGGLSQLIQPDPSIETSGVDDQRVAFPFTGRVSMPRWLDVGMRREFAAIEESLPPEIEGLVDEEDDAWRLDDPPRRRSQEDLGHTLGQAVRIRFVPPVQPFCSFIVEGLCPGLERNRPPSGLVRGSSDTPGAGSRLPTGPACRPANVAPARKIRFAIGRAWDGLRRDLHPLRKCRRTEKSHDGELEQCSQRPPPLCYLGSVRSRYLRTACSRCR